MTTHLRSRRRQSNVGAHAPGRPARIPPITDYEARRRALQVLAVGGPPPGAARAIELLAEAGVMTQTQLEALADVSYDTLLDYRHAYYLALVPAPLSLQRLLPGTGRMVYVLGPVGLLLAERGGRRVPKGYQLDLAVDHITHDVLCTAVFHRLQEALLPHGWEVTRRGKYAATVLDAAGEPELEPDAHLVLRHPAGTTRHFLLEYHHEDWGTRAAGKIEGYERLLELADERRWREAWKMPAPARGRPSVLPRVLVVWTHAAVGAGYRRAVRERAEAEDGLWTLYLGKSLTELLDPQEDPLCWHCFTWERPHHLLEQQ